MNARDQDVVAPADEAEVPSAAAASAIDDESRSLIIMDPDDPAYTSKQAKLFEEAFIRTLRGDAEGALSTFLFHDLPVVEASRVFGDLDYDAADLLSGGRAWERRIAENSLRLPGDHNFGGDDHRIIRHGLQHGLLDVLPNDIKFVSYGGGDQQAFYANEGQILRAAISTNRFHITDFCAVDILPRFVHDEVYLVSQNFQVRSQGVRGDFLRNGRLRINPTPGSTPVIMIFGGPFENVGRDHQSPDVETNMAVAWAKMNVQHGLGSIVIKTFDAEQNPQAQLNKYKPTKAFEAFELSFFARAAVQGVIKNPKYDVFEHWRLVSEFDDAAKGVRLIAECKKDHVLQTTQGDFKFTAGDRSIVPTLSHKWDLAQHSRLIERAGGEIVRAYQEPGNPNILLAVRFVREPEPDIRKLIPY